MESVTLQDLNGDEKLDIVYKTGACKIAWLENEFFNASTSIAPFDIDNDGDIDIVGAYYNLGSLLVWYENTDGNGIFAEAQEIHEFYFPSSYTHIGNILPSDINGDGNIDLILNTTHEEYYSYILWIENIDTQGTFGLPNIVHINETSLGSLYTFDIDSDNDQDILISYYWGPNAKISWHENLDGLGNFSSQIIISEEVIRATDASASDLNSDGKIDVISSSQIDTKVAWYQNMGNLGFLDKTTNLFNIFPNPTNGKLTITSELQITSIVIYNNLGQKILELKNQSEVNLSSFNAGIYFLKIINDTGNSETHKVIKE